jgi:hypothetical protein
VFPGKFQVVHDGLTQTLPALRISSGCVHCTRDDERLRCLVPSLHQEMVSAVLSDPVPHSELNEVPAAARLLDAS